MHKHREMLDSYFFCKSNTSSEAIKAICTAKRASLIESLNPHPFKSFIYIRIKRKSKAVMLKLG